MSDVLAVGRSPLAVYTPVPPTRTGVAHYASMLIPALQAKFDVEVISSDGQRPTANGQRIYQLGNNPHHEWIYKEAMQHPGVIVLHDIVLHHLIVEMTLARGDVDGYVAALEANHGAAGAAWARGRAAGLHSEMGNFLLPASIEIANRSSAVIVHNHYAADRLQSLGVRTPIHVVPHPYEPQHVPKGGRKNVIGLFGFLTSAKRSDVVLQAFREARTTNRDVRLLIVGEPAPNIDTSAFAGDGIVFTGYVPDEEFVNYFAEVDRVVNLRYPTAGETSGTLIRAFDAGKPVAVSDYAQFAELPDDCVTKIPLGSGEVEALMKFFTADLRDDYIHVARHLLHRGLDFVGDVGDHLDGLAEIIAAALAGDDLLVDSAAGEIVGLRELGVGEALVVPEVEIGLGAIVGDEDFAVLEGTHGAGIDVEVGVEFLAGDFEAAALQQTADRGGGDPLPERGNHTTRYENKFSH